MDPFKVLSNGVKFNHKFKNDLEKFKVQKRDYSQHDTSNVILNKTQDTQSKPKNASVLMKRRKIDGDQLRQEHSIIVDGADIPCPIQTFEELNIPDYLKSNLRKSNYNVPTPIQMQVIPLMLGCREIIGCAPTGSGKTLAFLLPIICQLQRPQQAGFRAIIIAPSRELAKQIHRECLWIAEGSGLRIHLIKNINLAMKKFAVDSPLKHDILITTPQRLEFLLKQDPPSINVENIEWLVVDECDRLFEPSFRDQLAQIFNICARSSKLKHAMFSATYDPHLHEWCKLNLTDIATVFIGGRNKVADTVDQKLVFTGTETGKLFALKELISNGCPTPVLIFVNKISKANFLQREIISMNVSADAIHSDRSQEYRDKIVRAFREGKILFLICTELMGRGIDFKAVNLVINYDLPSSTFAYIHHIGRTGRAGRAGTAITYYTLKDEPNLPPILNVMRQSACDIPSHLQGLNKKKALMFKKLEKSQSKKKKNHS